MSRRRKNATVSSRSTFTVPTSDSEEESPAISGLSIEEHILLPSSREGFTHSTQPAVYIPDPSPLTGHQLSSNTPKRRASELQRASHTSPYDLGPLDPDVSSSASDFAAREPYAAPPDSDEEYEPVLFEVTDEGWEYWVKTKMVSSVRWSNPLFLLTLRSPQTTNDQMRRFLSLRRDYLHVVTQLEGQLGYDFCQECLRQFADLPIRTMYRCDDCRPRRHLCTDCMRDEHQNHPFHQICAWFDDHWEPSMLIDVGVVIFLGHGGRCCPSQAQSIPGLSGYIIQEYSDPASSVGDTDSSPFLTSTNTPGHWKDLDVTTPSLGAENWQTQLRHKSNRADSGADDSDDSDESDSDADDTDSDSDGRECLSSDTDVDFDHNPEKEQRNREQERVLGEARAFIVAHSNGFHHIRIIPCACSDHQTFDRQLLFAQLFPATYRRPKTAFTFDCLRDFRTMNLECKTSIQAYHTFLSLRTKWAYHLKLPNRLSELTRAIRQWRNLMTLQTFGYGHCDDKPGDGDLAWFCAACPNPDDNLPPDFASDENKYVGLHRRRRTIS